ncbi:hypothetical protein CFP71_13445 [Amycolatopsis thailandensis]|uniref:Uncharacterized protein n=1 Tax=Amycolatopsis thailandensis TaxID=589330 RepID=A0A229SBW8_9PSEU|nr:hypothetical protein [Amycolatopsis thailandensis]OXM56427.1 hypothetical protein CFP71_13445 [Amycolatopsis thailandensis]
MGWAKSDRLPNEGLRDHFERQLFEYTNHTIVESAVVDNVFYAAVRTRGTKKVWALVVLLRRSGGKTIEYRDIEEVDGPGEFKAPAFILNALSDTTNQKALRWRERCRANL